MVARDYFTFFCQGIRFLGRLNMAGSRFRAGVTCDVDRSKVRCAHVGGLIVWSGGELPPLTAASTPAQFWVSFSLYLFSKARVRELIMYYFLNSMRHVETCIRDSGMVQTYSA